MKLVMTLLVRDEADIVDEQLRYHLEQGVDFVIATDHRSTDGTTEILRRYEREGRLHLLREESAELGQAEWVTRMARLAATDCGADWVINSDADEFWWPRDGSLRDVLAAIPARFGAIRGLWRHFVPRPATPEPFFERMVVRRRSSSDFTSPYHPQVKVLHRADPEVVISQGNHDAFGRDLVLIREWCPFEVLHFPVRSREQMERKFLVWDTGGRVEAARVPRHTRAAVQAVRATDGDAVFGELLVDDEALAEGLAAGDLAIDTRLRDVLRCQPGERASTSPPSLADDVAFAEELDALLETDATIRLGRRTDAFERRLVAIEEATTALPGKARRRAARALRR